MNKTKVLKNLLAGIIIVLICVILSIPAILKMNSEITEYKNKTQSLEQEIIQLKKSIRNEQNNSSSINNSVKQSNVVEEKSVEKNEDGTVENEKETTENTVSDTVAKKETNTSTYQQNNYSNNATISNTNNQSYSQNTQTYSTNTANTSTGNYYILNKSTKKFHIPTCKSVKQMNDSNKIEFHGTRNDAISNGYSPCGNCHP